VLTCKLALVPYGPSRKLTLSSLISFSASVALFCAFALVVIVFRVDLVVLAVNDDATGLVVDLFPQFVTFAAQIALLGEAPVKAIGTPNRIVPSYGPSYSGAPAIVASGVAVPGCEWSH
jgi:hypothetical protein